MRMLLIIIMGIVLTACASHSIRESIDAFDQIADQIQLGAEKADVLAVLQPVQTMLPATEQKRAEKYQQNGVLVEIYYMRSALFADGLVTDDEFTPFVFHDGILVGIGWQLLGGPKTQGQAQSNTTVIRTWDPYFY